MTVILAHLICMASALPSAASLEGAISELEKAITPLENSSGWWEKSLPWFTGLVVIGLIADLVIILLERRGEMAHWRRWVSVGMYSSNRPSRVTFLFELFATSAIFLGVAGELWAGSEIAYLNGQLRSKNAELRTTSDQLVELLHHETENERAARVAAEESVAWRRLTPDNRRQLRSELRSFVVNRTWFQYNANDTEAFTFGNDLAASLPAGWNPTEPMPVSSLKEGPIPLGKYVPERSVLVAAIGDKSYEEAAKMLVRLLSSFGFDCKTSNAGLALAREFSPMIVISVEPRPEGPQGEAKLRAEARRKQTRSSQIGP